MSFQYVVGLCFLCLFFVCQEPIALNGQPKSFYDLIVKATWQVLRIFIDRLPSLDFLNNRGETPLHYAAWAAECTTSCIGYAFRTIILF